LGASYFDVEYSHSVVVAAGGHHVIDSVRVSGYRSVLSEFNPPDSETVGQVLVKLVDGLPLLGLLDPHPE